ncbi:SDR family NAD(P)-dependent oxidoreductase [Flavobacteriaceae bacterium F08102]|nr:SDR family NAD(P)-dependent oxidoreductase [Flavobacteriaceae bacterium F08102]
MKDLRLKYGNRVLITGGSSGIGKAFAIELSKQGFQPYLVAKTQKKLDIVKLQLKIEHKVNAITFSVDLSNEYEVLNLIEEIKNEDIGLFIHCAGMENNGSITKIAPLKELQLLKLNVNATYLLTNHFARKMQEKKRGGILLVSSVAGLMPTPYFSNYAASKSYVHNFGLSLYAELKRDGIDVSVLAPGLTETNMTKGNGVDWKKFPMKLMTPYKVVRISLANLGRKATIIPGFKNKLMVGMAKRIFSNKRLSKINASMIRKGIQAKKI